MFEFGETAGPVIMFIIPVVFYLVLWVCGISFAEVCTSSLPAYSPCSRRERTTGCSRSRPPPTAGICGNNFHSLKFSGVSSSFSSLPS
jgi:hypothetical protein